MRMRLLTMTMMGVALSGVLHAQAVDSGRRARGRGVGTRRDLAGHEDPLHDHDHPARHGRNS